MQLCPDYWSSYILFSGRRPAIPSGVFCGLPGSVRVNVRLILRTRQLFFHILSNLLFTINLIFLCYVYSELRIASLNKPQIREHTYRLCSCLSARTCAVDRLDIGCGASCPPRSCPPPWLCTRIASAS